MLIIPIVYKLYFDIDPTNAHIKFHSYSHNSCYYPDIYNYLQPLHPCTTKYKVAEATVSDGKRRALASK